VGLWRGAYQRSLRTNCNWRLLVVVEVITPAALETLDGFLDLDCR
jgi:hypothetical protein